jgi:hypothetical protein
VQENKQFVCASTTDSCAAINDDEVMKRRGKLPIDNQSAIIYLAVMMVMAMHLQQQQQFVVKTSTN